MHSQLLEVLVHPMQAKYSLLIVSLLSSSTFASSIFLSHRPILFIPTICSVLVFPYPKPNAMKYVNAYTHFHIRNILVQQLQLVTKLKINCASQHHRKLTQTVYSAANKFGVQKAIEKYQSMKNEHLFCYEINWQEINGLWHKNPIPNPQDLSIIHDAVDSWFLCTYVFSQTTNANIIMTSLLNGLNFSARDYIHHSVSQSVDPGSAPSASPGSLHM